MVPLVNNNIKNTENLIDISINTNELYRELKVVTSSEDLHIGDIIKKKFCNSNSPIYYVVLYSSMFAGCCLNHENNKRELDQSKYGKPLFRLLNNIGNEQYLFYSNPNFIFDFDFSYKSFTLSYHCNLNELNNLINVYDYLELYKKLVNNPDEIHKYGIYYHKINFNRFAFIPYDITYNAITGYMLDTDEGSITRTTMTIYNLLTKYNYNDIKLIDGTSYFTLRALEDKYCGLYYDQDFVSRIMHNQ